ncbi:protein nrt1/ ptr family 5.4 [Quercus suber]|uniref:Protein nrt1/ ptr family 5.4 n=1 Tax=Quercus suber TaxID=58331 RepID=A0AAW0KIK1_QUESU
MIIDDIDASSESRNPWRLCSLNQVEEVKLVLCLIPIWLNSIMFGVVATNFSTYFTKQGTTMIRSIGPNFQLPAASLQALFGLTFMITTAFYDQVLVPITRKFFGHHLVCGGYFHNTYYVVNLAAVFTLVGLQELFYDQMPESLRSFGAALYLSVLGIGSFISSAIIYIVQAISSGCGEKWLGNNLNHAHLDYFYWMLAGLSSLNLCVYIGISKRFVYKKV